MNKLTIIEQLEDIVDSLAEIKGEMCALCKYNEECCINGARGDCPLEEI